MEHVGQGKPTPLSCRSLCLAGDTWIYGVASDPKKTARMRAAMRRGSRCLADAACAANEPGLGNFSFFLSKTTEHTWGGSYAGHMNITQPSGADTWSNEAFEKVRLPRHASRNREGRRLFQPLTCAPSHTPLRLLHRVRSGVDLPIQNRAAGVDPFYAVAQASWDEQRLYLDHALLALDRGAGGAAAASSDGSSDGLGHGQGDSSHVAARALGSTGGAAAAGVGKSALAAAIRAEYAALELDTVSDLTDRGYAPVARSAWDVTAPDFSGVPLGVATTVGVDPATGALAHCSVTSSSSVTSSASSGTADDVTAWASAASPLFRFLYRAHSYKEKQHFSEVNLCGNNYAVTMR